MIIEVFGTLCMLQFYSRKPVNLLQACSFSAHLPKFNPAIPKLQELGEDLQDRTPREKLKTKKWSEYLKNHVN